jgi:outer membrane protein, multidrug efflux system
MRPTRQVACALAVLLSGCSLAPRYQPPKPAAVSAFKEAGDWLPAQPADAGVHGTWWLAFADASLDHLEDQLSSGTSGGVAGSGAGGNPDL